MNIFSLVQSQIRQAFSDDRRIATVYDNNFATGLLRVEYEGRQDPVGYRYIGALPADGDEVFMIRHGGKWLVLGKLAPL